MYNECMYSVIPALTAIYFFVSGILVLRKDPRNLTNITFFGLCITTFMWQFTWSILFQVSDPILTHFLVKLGYFFIIFLPTFLYHFLVEISGRKEERKFVYVSYAVCLIFVGTLFSDTLFVSGHYSYFWGSYPKAGSIHWVHILQTVVLFNRSLYIVMREVFKVGDLERRVQLKYCAASLIMYFFSALDYLCNYGFEFYPPGILFILFSITLLAIAATKYHFLNFSILIKKSTSAAIVAILACLLILVVYIFVSLRPQIYLGLIMGIVSAFAIFGGKLQEILITTANRTFVKGWYDPEQVINRFLKLLGPVYSIQEGFSVVAETLDDTLELRYSHAFVIEEAAHTDATHYQCTSINNCTIPGNTTFIQSLERTENSFIGPEIMSEFDCLGIDLVPHPACIFPIKYNNLLQGFIVLGPKDAGGNFSTKDFRLIETLLLQFNILLERFIKYEKIKSELEQAQTFVEKTKQEASYANLTKGIAHELKNPLRMIKSGFELIDLAAEKPEKLKSYAKTIVQSINRLFGMIDAMMKFDQTDISEKKSVNISDFITDFLTLANGSLTQKNIAVQTKLSNLEPIQADPVALQQILSNLVTNAIEALSAVEGRDRVISISTSLESFYLNDQMNRGVLIQIQDNGPGISQTDKDKIFDAFYTTKDLNTGLGLSITLRLINSHGGSLVVESDPEQTPGTSFKVYLPI